MDDYIYVCMHIHEYIYISRVLYKKKSLTYVCNEKMCKWMITYIYMKIYIHIYIYM